MTMLRALIKKIRHYTRQKRSRLFFQFMAEFNDKPIRIIDLGGTAAFWEDWGITSDHHVEITLINNHHIDTTQKGYDHSIPFIKEQIKDVNELETHDFYGYDLIFSNSMIEHLESNALQKRLCEVIEASGLPYFIQTPNKKSLVDPHFPHPLVPFFAAYPKRLQATLLTIHHFNGGTRAVSHQEAWQRLKYYTPLSKTGFERLLPEGTLTAESFLGIAPSLVMTRLLKKHSPTKTTILQEPEMA